MICNLINSAQNKNGFSNLLKLIPLVKIAIISVSFAILEVKKVTDIKINKELNRFIKNKVQIIFKNNLI